MSVHCCPSYPCPICEANRAQRGTPIFAQAPARPYRCPVCIGRGHMPHDFYNQFGVATSTNPVKCRSCNGTGIVR